MRRASFLRILAIAAVAAGGLLLLNYLAPLRWPSTLAYSGLAAMLAGVLSLLVPARWLGFSTRGQGLVLGLVAGGALFAAGWFWPAGSYRSASTASLLDAFMPEYNFSERHEMTIEATPERVRAAINRVSFADLGMMKTLGAIRNAVVNRKLPARGAQAAMPSTPIVEIVKTPRTGFFPLCDTPREFVFGLAGQPWNNLAVRLKAEEFTAWKSPGNIKVVANFLILDAGNGRSRVITETRIAASDETARRTMGKYWTLIYPGSGLLRRNLLEAIRERAERPAGTPST